MSEKKPVYRIEDGMNRDDVLCTTYQMRNFYMQFKDGFFSNLDVMNYIQHHKAALMAKKNMRVLDVCCGRAMMLPLLRYYAKDIKSYTGVDISESNIKEAIKGASSKNLTKDELGSYYPFDVDFINSNVAEMSKHIERESMDFVIYTSALEHMHKDVGYQSLQECHTVMTDDAKMFLSCPNTPGNGYDTQYRAHVYEWGYHELQEALDEIGFVITEEVGLVMGAKEMDEFYSNHVHKAVRDMYLQLKKYMPTAWLTAVMAIPYPEASKEILFVVKKKDRRRKLF